MSDNFKTHQELALPGSVIENFVLVFQTAVKVMRESVLMEAKASYYSGLIGKTMSEILSEAGNTTSKNSTVWVRTEFEKRYLTLKDAAWANVLRSSQVTEKLSSAAQKRVESEFDTIKELEFSVANVEGFLRGLIENQSKIKMDMACDVFDLIVRYHSDNTVFYRGWKSNDDHRTCGMRIKTTRFVIPGNSGYGSSLNWESNKRLSDFDKVFAMLDGKDEPEIGLCDVFKNQYKELKDGERISSSYFDVRYYPKVGTIHFFARDKELIEKFNVLVGQHRKWLPPSDVTASTSFWEQFKKAEKFDKEVRATVDANHKNSGRSSWNEPLREVFSSSKDETRKASAAIDDALVTVQEKNGMSVDFRIGVGGSEMVKKFIGFDQKV
jgi:hypothetical protein